MVILLTQLADLQLSYQKGVYMDWRIWNERQKKKEKLKKRYKKFMTDYHGTVMFKFKDRRKDG